MAIVVSADPLFVFTQSAYWTLWNTIMPKWGTGNSTAVQQTEIACVGAQLLGVQGVWSVWWIFLSVCD